MDQTMCLLSVIRGGAAQSRASGGNEPHDEPARAETTTPSSPRPVSQHSRTHSDSNASVLCKHICSPLTANVCICHNKPIAELGEKGMQSAGSHGGNEEGK